MLLVEDSESGRAAIDEVIGKNAVNIDTCYVVGGEKVISSDLYGYISSKVNS